MLKIGLVRADDCVHSKLAYVTRRYDSILYYCMMIVCLVGLCRREILVSHCLIRFLSILNCMRKITSVSSLRQLYPVFLMLWLVEFLLLQNLIMCYFMNSASITSVSVNLNLIYLFLKSQVTLIY